MTRLTEQDIDGLGATWTDYERRLSALSGYSLIELAAQALGLETTIGRAIPGLTVGVVPVSSGEGLIGGFAESLASIAGHLGFAVRILPQDEAGFRAAKNGACDLFLWADDETFLAENVRSGTICENGQATGRGFATALMRMAERTTSVREDRRALVLGAGPVGRNGAAALVSAGYRVTLCDLDLEKARAVSQNIPCQPCGPGDLDAMPPFPCLLDAAPTNNCFPVHRLQPEACIAAPCVPCLWGSCAPERAAVWHDPLQLGTAVMLLGAAFLP